MSEKLLRIVGSTTLGPATLCVSAALALAACSNPVDDRENVLPQADVAFVEVVDAVDAVADLAGDVTAAAPACDCLQPGQWFRFDQLRLDSIDNDPDHGVIGALNPLWKKDIGAFELNFYFEVVKVSPAEVEFRVINAARVGTNGDTCLVPETETAVIFPRKDCQLLLSAPTGINVYAGTQKNVKNCSVGTTSFPGSGGKPLRHVIPVRKARLRADIGTSCDTIVNGKVETGNFSKFALENTCTCLVTNPKDNSDICTPPDPNYVDESCGGCSDKFASLSALLNALGGEKYPDGLKYNCKAEDDGPAACLEATFAAKRIVPPPPVCP